MRISIDVPDAIEELSISELPMDWDALKYPDNLPFFLLPKLTPVYPALAFSVPSVVLKNSPSRNILINPLHPHMSQVKVVEVLANEFDERLRK